MTPSDDKRRHAAQVNRALARLYPDAHCALTHATPFQLLVATILSAQCTDARVNLVTPALFRRFPDARAMARADLADVEALVRSTGFFRSKARNIVECSKRLVEDHDGGVPGSLDQLVPLPGVGRKTANVVLGDAFGVPGITVDTHVKRLSRRLGLTDAETPEKIERHLMELLRRRDWTVFSHRMIFHGRQVCHAHRPQCDACALRPICPRVGVAAS